jgi:hypothetical protein
MLTCIRCNDSFIPNTLQLAMIHPICQNCISDNGDWTNNGTVTEKAMRLSMPVEGQE